jgi:hypothetical protein
VTPILGRYDASYGLMLRGKGDGHFEPIDMEKSGVTIEGEVRRIKSIRGAKGARLIAVARNNEKLEILRVRPAR